MSVSNNALFPRQQRFPVNTVVTSTMWEAHYSTFLTTETHNFLYSTEICYESNVFLHLYQAIMESRSGGIAPRILNLRTSWRWAVSFTSRPLYPWKPLGKKLGGPQNLSGRGGSEEKKSPRPCRETNPFFQLVA